MQSQKLCLKWNNHTTNLLSVLQNFQRKEIFVDVTLSCEGRSIKAHKMVLSACSPYFQNIFLDNPCQHPIVIMNGMKYEDINAILSFMYRGEVNISNEGLSSFLQAAEALKVRGLAEVCEQVSTNSNSQENQPAEQPRPQRTETPNRKRHRNRKRSLSDSNRSDEEGAPRKHKEPSSPEVHELSGDESYTGDMTSNGPPFNSLPRVPQTVYSRTHQSSSNLGGEDVEDDYEVEPSKLLEQTLTTESVSMNSSNSDNNLRIERIMGNATEIESSSMQEPESPPDIKPIIDYGESSAGPSEGSMLVYNDQSQPGPSNMQDGGSLLHDNSHAQGKNTYQSSKRLNNIHSKEKLGAFGCFQCPYRTNDGAAIAKHLNEHAACRRKLIKKCSGKKFTCCNCNYKTNSDYNISMHLQRHSGFLNNNVKAACKVQDVRDKERNFIPAHQEVKEENHISSEQKPTSHVCNICNKIFHYEVNLKAHLKSHEVTYCCDGCDATFNDLHNLAVHRKFSHRPKQFYVCTVCNKRFGNIIAYSQHRSIHPDD